MLTYKKSDILRGGIIYCVGDTIAAIILNEFMLSRMLGILFVGLTFYAFEIPNYFKWIDNRVGGHQGLVKSVYKTGLAMLYFNPLWIARHLLFIKLFSMRWEQVNWGLLEIAAWSFIVNIPISLVANFIIQNKIRVDWRFMASAIFSALMAIYYAMSITWFA